MSKVYPSLCDIIKDYNVISMKAYIHPIINDQNIDCICNNNSEIQISIDDDKVTIYEFGGFYHSYLHRIVNTKIKWYLFYNKE
jgi:hypothetical protein